MGFDEKVEKTVWFVFFFNAIIAMAILGLIGWVAYHFISKWW